MPAKAGIQNNAASELRAGFIFIDRPVSAWEPRPASGGAMKKTLFFALVACTLLGLPQAFAQQEIILATTTSVQDTGLLDVIVPIFEKENGSRVKAVAVGTGQALALAG